MFHSSFIIPSMTMIGLVISVTVKEDLTEMILVLNSDSEVTSEETCM